MLKYINTYNKSRRRKIVAWCQVGHENILPHNEWAGKKSRKKSLEPGPPPRPI